MDLNKCLEILEEKNRLIKIESEVDLKHELAGVAAKFEGKEVVVFENIKGHSTHLVMGMFWNRDNLAQIYNCSAKNLPFVVGDAIDKINSIEKPFEYVENAKAQEVIELEPDLYSIPIPTLALKDGGPYFANSVVIAKDPDTGIRNSSVHRLMLTGKNKLGMLMDYGRHIRDYYERAEAKGQGLEITINCGVSPSVYIAAITPSSAVSIDKDELAVAAVLDKEPVKLCKSKTVGVCGIADAQYIIEAEILPHVREPEGPFGEVTGYYAQEDDRWVVHVKAVTRRENPIACNLLPGKEVWNSVGLTAEANIYQSVSKQIPGIKDVYLSHGGGGFYYGIIQIDPPKNGMAKNAILSTFAAFPPLQMVTAVNSDVDIYDSDDVFRAMSTRCKYDEDIINISKSFGHELNPSTDNGIGSKIGFDCTYPIPKPEAYERVKFKEVDINNYKYTKKV